MTPEESDRFALNLSIAVAKNITSKTWLSGLSDFFDVLSDPERYGRNYVARLAGSMAGPAMVSQMRSEERRVGKEWVRPCRFRWASSNSKNNKQLDHRCTRRQHT